MEAHRAHYASTRAREENQHLHPLLQTLWIKGRTVKKCLLQDSTNNAHSDQYTSVMLWWWELALCAKARVLPSIMQCVNTAGSRCCGVRFHSTHSAPWWKWRNATGYLNIRGSQEHFFIVPMYAPLQIDFPQRAHAHTTRPRMAPWTGQQNQLTVLTCSVTRSQLSICRMTRKTQKKPAAEHSSGSSRDSPAQKAER